MILFGDLITLHQARNLVVGTNTTDAHVIRREVEIMMGTLAYAKEEEETQIHQPRQCVKTIDRMAKFVFFT